ncbi:hypothetical protein K493DRAFT_315515 [Basidiobolus meristosporus CBS 931.73]|uniref:Uncharacterized protein n=1 Tax=Basidiobolus meristosporus CBS 931.73 TaxID=1314790 RepID=A0A1Y1Y9F8_9FUNG|nr:hypothetical protein K493DRAFT_315515 [Basidiobolus meristosporus CBS 931.73]|eukprot:ORX94376.1 hypothetical protein K493DRAFT_315515 [Basidiobolus meristosporus CBS 931.73]
MAASNNSTIAEALALQNELKELENLDLGSLLKDMNDADTALTDLDRKVDTLNSKIQELLRRAEEEKQQREQ